mgnify:FL=1
MANQDINDPMNPKPTTPTREQASQTSSDVMEESKRKASEMSSRAKEQFNKAMETGKSKAEQARVSAADGLERAASKVQETAGRLPGGERVQGAVRSISTGMERSATYLREHDLTDMQSDVENFVRRHPGQSLIAALAAGFLLAQTIRRSRH